MNNLQSVSIVAAFPIGAVIVMIAASFLKDAKKYQAAPSRNTMQRNAVSARTAESENGSSLRRKPHQTLLWPEHSVAESAAESHLHAGAGTGTGKDGLL